MNGVHVHVVYMHISQDVILTCAYDSVASKVLYYAFYDCLPSNVIRTHSVLLEIYAE